MRKRPLLLSLAALLVAPVASGDGPRLSVSPSVVLAPALHAHDVIVAVGAQTTLAVTMSHGAGAVGNRDVSFSVGGTVVGSAHTDADGVATLAWKPGDSLTPGTLSYTASYAGSGDMGAASDTAPVHLLKAPTNVSRYALADGGNQKTIYVVMGHTVQVDGKLVRMTDGHGVSGASVKLVLNGRSVADAKTGVDGFFSWPNVKAQQLHDSYAVTFDGNDSYGASTSAPIKVEVVPPPRIAHACAVTAPATAVTHQPFSVNVTMCLGDYGSQLGLPASDGTFEFTLGVPQSTATPGWGLSQTFHTDAAGKATVSVTADDAGLGEIGVLDADVKYWVAGYVVLGRTEVRRERVFVSGSFPDHAKSGQPITGHASAKKEDGKAVDFGAVFVLHESKEVALTPSAPTATLTATFDLVPNVPAATAQLDVFWQTEKHGYLGIGVGEAIRVTR